MNLLLVEDDADLCAALARVLGKRGFAVTTANDGVTALALLKNNAFDAVILDLGIPGVDGLQLLRRLHARRSSVPVLVLTARSAVGDRVAGLKAGADDYLGKPFDIEELHARIDALIRRSRGLDDPSCGSLRYERRSGAFYVNQRALVLTPRERAMLTALMTEPGHAVTRERLMMLIFANEPMMHTDALDVVVHRLRKKLADTNTIITTLRGLGYLIQDENVAPIEQQ